MGGYTRPVFGQQLNKNVRVARQQILNNATVEFQQYKSFVFYVVRAERLYAGRSLELSSVLRRWPARNGVNAEAEKISLLKAVTRKRTVKALQIEKGLAGAVVIWRLVVAL
jgi:hypothetical protein